MAWPVSGDQNGAQRKGVRQKEKEAGGRGGLKQTGPKFLLWTTLAAPANIVYNYGELDEKGG